MLVINFKSDEKMKMIQIFLKWLKFQSNLGNFQEHLKFEYLIIYFNIKQLYLQITYI